jgi:hypothetical protein
MNTAVLSSSTGISFNSTPRRRPSCLLARLSEAAKKAPYAYTPHRRSYIVRPQTPPTPCPQETRKIVKEPQNVSQGAAREGQDIPFHPSNPANMLVMIPIIPHKRHKTSADMDEGMSSHGKFDNGITLRLDLPDILANSQIAKHKRHKTSTVMDEGWTSRGKLDDSIALCLDLPDIPVNAQIAPHKRDKTSIVMDEGWTSRGKLDDKIALGLDLPDIPANAQIAPHKRDQTSTVVDEGRTSRGKLDDSIALCLDLPDILANSQIAPHTHHTTPTVVDKGLSSREKCYDGITCLNSINYQEDPSRAAIHDDPMKFSLRDAVSGETRYPDQMELLELHRVFPECKSIDFQDGLIILNCKSPPTKPTYKVAGLPAIFVPPEETFTLIPGTSGNPRVRDFVSPFNTNSESEFQFLDRLLIALFKHNLKPVSASIYFNWLVIELKEHISSYELPGRLGGFSPFYCCGYRPFGSHKVSLSRMVTPTDDIIDDTDYTEQGLSPGIRVCGVMEAATSGLLLLNRYSGEKRVTVANHAFSDTTKVYHPYTHPDMCIGEITGRHHNLDIALVKLKDDTEYYNSFYFSAPVPKKLASSVQQSSHVKGANHRPWYFIESAFSGLIPLIYAGRHSGFPDEDYSQPYHRLHFSHSYITKSMGVNLQQLKRGICGSPIVLDDYDADEENKGSVIGFFSYADGNPDIENVFIPVLDELMAMGWDIA